MSKCGYFIYPTYETIITTNEEIKSKEENNNNTKSFSIFIKNNSDKNNNNKRKPLFLSNKFLNFLNPNEKKFNYGFYAFMLIRVIDGKDKKNDAIIGYSQNPIYSTYIHNKQKSIKEQQLPDKYSEWELKIILGNFILKKACQQCCIEWLEKTRGIDSKTQKAKYLKNKYNVDLYSNESYSKKDLQDYMIKNLPKKFVLEYNKLNY